MYKLKGKGILTTKAWGREARGEEYPTLVRTIKKSLSSFTYIDTFSTSAVKLIILTDLLHFSKGRRKVFFVVGPLRGGAVKLLEPFFSVKKKWPKPHEQLSHTGGGDTLTLVVRPLKKTIICVFPKRKKKIKGVCKKELDFLRDNMSLWWIFLIHFIL